jgi:hypothetical protein
MDYLLVSGCWVLVLTSTSIKEQATRIWASWKKIIKNNVGNELLIQNWGESARHFKFSVGCYSG